MFKTRKLSSIKFLLIHSQKFMKQQLTVEYQIRSRRLNLSVFVDLSPHETKETYYLKFPLQPISRAMLKDEGALVIARLSSAFICISERLTCLHTCLTCLLHFLPL
ncbi:hypothetical protein AMECASPLE_017311 [Ameca splendens]|uniref:Uncharacterized protein n=1 Tax=Ameca splendens TaxID=208324 RepID=A0ABV0XRH1_9TELE